MKDMSGDMPETEGTRDRGEKRQRLDAIPDMIRRTIYAGMGAILTSDDLVRRFASDFSLPKDVASYLISHASATKNELFRIFAGETRRFLEGLRLNEELQRLLSGMSIEVKTEISFSPKKDANEPTIKPQVRLRRNGDNEDTTDASGDKAAESAVDSPEHNA